MGYSVLLSDVDIVTLQNPFNFLYRDSDVESMSDGFDNNTAYGWDDVMDDPGMGWGRYAHTMRIFVFNSGLFFIRPSPRTVNLMDRITDRLAKEKAWDQAVFNEEIFRPSRPGSYQSPKISTRAMDMYLFANSKVGESSATRRRKGAIGFRPSVRLGMYLPPHRIEARLFDLAGYLQDRSYKL